MSSHFYIWLIMQSELYSICVLHKTFILLNSFSFFSFWWLTCNPFFRVKFLHFQMVRKHRSVVFNFTSHEYYVADIKELFVLVYPSLFLSNLNHGFAQCTR